MYCRLEDFFYLMLYMGSAETKFGLGLSLTWVWQTGSFELWTGSDMGSSDLEFELETGPVRSLADPELAYCSSLGLDPNWLIQSSN